MATSDSNQMIKRLIPPLALWIASKLLQTRKVKGALDEVDSYTYIGKRKAARAVKRAGRNAVKNSTWLAASAAAFAVGIGLMVKAGSKPKP